MKEEPMEIVALIVLLCVAVLSNRVLGGTEEMRAAVRRGRLRRDIEAVLNFKPRRAVVARWSEEELVAAEAWVARALAELRGEAVAHVPMPMCVRVLGLTRERGGRLGAPAEIYHEPHSETMPPVERPRA
jgi:hypothetical protein